MYFVKKWGLYAPTWEALQLQKLTDAAIDARIRRLAAADDLIAFKHRRLWYFKDVRNTLQSPETGLDQQEAWEYLTEAAEHHSRDSEFEAVIDELALLYPGTVDYHIEEGDVFCLLDKDDRVIATIDEREMTGVWNAVELASPECGKSAELPLLGATEALSDRVDVGKGGGGTMNENTINEDEEICEETVSPEEELLIFWEDLEITHRLLQEAISRGDLGGIQNAADYLRESICCSQLRTGGSK